MGNRDRELGMNRSISRRDLIHGIGALAGTALMPGRALAEAVSAMEQNKQPAYYPPGRTGMRGNHDGAWEVAHALAREGNKEWGKALEDDTTVYDLVVVGAGISGLSAAYFWLQENPGASVLILDNHDDFGGHARRNEFSVGGKTLIGYGGSQTLVEPSSQPRVVKALLADIGVNSQKLGDGYDQDFYRRNGLAQGTFFNREAWGSNRLVRFELGEMYEEYLPLALTGKSAEAAVGEMPISAPAQAQLLKVLQVKGTRVKGATESARWNYLSSISYRDFLKLHLGVTEPDVFKLLQDMAYDSGVGIESVSAASAIFYAGMPGAAVTGISSEESEPYIHHFPDGNASVARLLVQHMIPEVAASASMEDIVTARFDYSQLDQAGHPVRLRLNSTAVAVSHRGDPATAREVDVEYVTGGQSHRVRGRHCILACYNAMIPALSPELPARQREALSQQVKMPMLYTTVAVRNWQAWKALGVGAVLAPGSYHINAMLDFPVSLGDYRYSTGPEQPTLVHMERLPHRSNQGLSRLDQYRAGRHELMATPYSDIERKVRQQLTDMLAPGGFDPATDIQGLTVNRWAHGYARWYSSLEDDTYDNPDDERYPHVQARQPFGRIAIANSDAGARAMLETAVMQARRAVDELS